MRDIHNDYNYNLPAFEPVTQEELRRIWVENPDPDVRRLALEVARYRKLFEDSALCFEVFQRSWRELNAGHSSALIHMKRLVDHERLRLPPDN